MSDLDPQWRTWVQRLVAGDQQAACDFWGEYGLRLQGLAAHCLTARLYRREAPEDVVQSVCRTFFRRAQAGQFELIDREGLWRLLCAITLAKVRQKARFHGRQRRRYTDEQSFGSDSDGKLLPAGNVQDQEPTPAEAAEFADQLRQLLEGMDDEERKLVELRLEQYTHPEMAEKMGCSERTVRRILNRVQSRLQRMLEDA